MRLIPSKRFCERFHSTYELKGVQRAVDLLSRYYGIRRMKIVVDGRRGEIPIKHVTMSLLRASRRRS